MKGFILFLFLIFASSYSFSQTNLKENSVTKFSNYNYVKIKDAGLKKVSALVKHKITLDDIVSKRFDGFESKSYVGKFINIEKWGLADLKTSQEITPIVYDHIDDEFINDVIFANSEKDYFLINKNGESTQLKNYKFIDRGSDEGYCCYKYDKEFRKFIDINNKVGFFSPNWEIAIPPIYEDIGNIFKDGLVVLKLNGKLGILNSDSEFFPLSNSVSRVENFNSYGFAEYTNLNNKIGIINKKGEIIVSAAYDGVRSVGENFSILLNKKEGIVNKEGKIIIPPNYYRVMLDQNYHTKESYYKVITLAKKEGIFDINGIQVIPPIYDEISTLSGKILVRLNGSEWSSIDDLNRTSSASTSTSKSPLLEGNSKNQQSSNSSNSSSSSNEFAVAILLGMLESSSGSSNNSSSSFTDQTPRQSGSSSSSSEVCSYCKPKDSKGHYIQDYNPNRKAFENGRYVLRPGHKPCTSCYGTGNCKAYNSCNSSQSFDWDMHKTGDLTCQICHGDRFMVCKECRGSGFRGK